MDLLKPIKTFVGQYLLTRTLKAQSRNPKFYNLDMAETVGVLYLYKNEVEFKLIEQLIKQLHDEKKKVKVLVYVQDAKMLEYLQPRLTVDYIRPKELDWFCKPNSVYAKDFMELKFDILIDLNLENSLPLKYASVLSQARYKVGLYTEENKDRLDLLIKMDAEKGLLYIIREIIRYLKILNTK